MVKTYSIFIHQELMGYLNSFTANNGFPISFFNLHRISNQLEIFERQMSNTTHLAIKHLPTILINPSYARIKNTTFAKFEIPIVNNETFTRQELARKSYFKQYPKGKYSIQIMNPKPFYTSQNGNTSFEDEPKPLCRKLKDTYYCPSKLLLKNTTNCLQSMSKNLINESSLLCNIKTRKIQNAFATIANKLYYAVSKSKQIIGQFANMNKTHLTLQGIGSVNIKDFARILIGNKIINHIATDKRHIKETNFNWGELLSETMAEYLTQEPESLIRRISQRNLKSDSLTKSYNLENLMYITPIVIITYSTVLLPVLGGYIIATYLSKKQKEKKERKMRRLTPFPQLNSRNNEQCRINHT